MDVALVATLRLDYGTLSLSSFFDLFPPHYRTIIFALLLVLCFGIVSFCFLLLVFFLSCFVSARFVRDIENSLFAADQRGREVFYSRDINCSREAHK
jgi:hypothetical protein